MCGQGFVDGSFRFEIFVDGNLGVEKIELRIRAKTFPRLIFSDMSLID